MGATLSVLALGMSLGLAVPAEASCPESGTPSREVCLHSSGMLLPSLLGMAYMPDDAGGPWFGGGVQFVLFTWSDNSPSFGPGQGKIKADVAMLASPEDGTERMVMFRGGASVSIERNASRSFLIPYFGGNVGVFHEPSLGSHAFVDGALGLYLLYLPSLIVDLEGAYVFPFEDANLFGGFRTQLTVSVALW